MMLEMAAQIAVDSKVRQMAVCNGLETLLCHREAVAPALPPVLDALHKEGVEIRGCTQTAQAFPHAQDASHEDWATEYLAPILAVRVVEDLEEAIAHLRTFGSDHTEIIVTEDEKHAYLRELVEYEQLIDRVLREEIQQPVSPY